MQRIMMCKTWGYLLIISLMALLQTGCGAALSERVRQEADRSLTFVQVRMQPEAYVNSLIIVGGDVARSTYVPGVVFLEVIQKPLDSEYRPQRTSQSDGRFMARCEGYLDPLVYTAGQVITLAGRVLGTHIEKIGDTEVPLPLLACVEIYAWSPPVYVVPAYPGGWYWWELDPWYWHHNHFGGHRRFRRYR